MEEHAKFKTKVINFCDKDYRFNRNRNGKIYYECIKKRKLTCKGLVILENNIFIEATCHNAKCTMNYDIMLNKNETVKEICQIENSINIFTICKTNLLSNNSFSNIESIIKFKCRRKHLCTKFRKQQ